MTCAYEWGCSDNTVGKSKYCYKHRREARQRWLEKVRESELISHQRNKKWASLFSVAQKKGVEAAKICTPNPMVVCQHQNPMDNNSPITEQWVVPDGPCGFALVNIKPGNCSFAIWLKKNGLARKSYYKGVDIWIGDYGQSYERKMAHAIAMAVEFNSAGINSTPMGRLD